MNLLSFRNPAHSYTSAGLVLCRRLLGYALLALLPALLLFGWSAYAFSVEIRVEAGQIKGYINPLVFGQNVFSNNNTMWDHRTDSLMKDPDDSGIKVKDKIEELAPTILRFPGGTSSDLYFWEDGLSILTKNELDASSDHIDLDDKPRNWSSSGKGLLLQTPVWPYELPWEPLRGQKGDAFDYSSVEVNNKKLNLPSPPLLNPPAWPNARYPVETEPPNPVKTGISIRPGGRKWNGHQVIDGTGEYDNTYGIVEHMKVVNSLGAEALITVNYRTRLNNDGTVYQSTPLPANDQRLKRAQALVAFCNGRTNDTRSLGLDDGSNDWYTVGYWARKRAALGFPQPFEVRFWQVGNEPYYDIYIRTNYPTIPAEYTRAFEAPLAATYGAHFNVFAQKMKEVDPKIKVWAAGMRPDQKSRSGGNYGENWENWDVWNEAVLNATKSDLDFFRFILITPITRYQAPRMTTTGLKRSWLGPPMHWLTSGISRVKSMKRYPLLERAILAWPSPSTASGAVAARTQNGPIWPGVFWMQISL